MATPLSSAIGKRTSPTVPSTRSNTSDLEPISLITSNPLLIVAKKDMPANDLAGLVAWLKANPERASLGTGGVGSVGHVSGILFQNTTTRFQFVPYRGVAPAM